MKASVIVCTYNRSSLLKCLLEALSHQSISLKEFEVVVVDDGSTDDTAEVCRNLKRQIGNLRYFAMGQNSGLGAAGNRAIELARSENLLFTDDDCIPHPRWVENLCLALKRSPVVAGAVISPLENYFQLCHNIAQFYPFMPGSKKRKTDFIAGANMGVRRKVFREIGFFEPHSPIPDMEFILKARFSGFSIAYAEDAVIIHSPKRFSFKGLLEYASAHSQHSIRLRIRYRKMLHTPVVLLSPAAILFFAPVIAIKTALGIYMGNVKLLRHIHTAPIVFCIKLAWCWGAARGLRAWRNSHE